MTKTELISKIKDLLFCVSALQSAQISISLSGGCQYIFKIKNINNTDFEIVSPQNVNHSFEYIVNRYVEEENQEILQFLVQANLKIKDIAQIDNLILQLKEIKIQELSFDYNRNDL